MRLNKDVDLFSLDRVKDGQGGFEEVKTFKKTIYCNISTISLDKQIQIFGVANHKSKNLITMDVIDIEKFCMLIDNIYYKPTGEPKRVGNKTYLVLDVLEHAN